MDGSLSSTLSGAAQLVSRKIRPVLFGGTPRPYHFVLLHANTYVCAPVDYAQFRLTKVIG